MPRMQAHGRRRQSSGGRGGDGRLRRLPARRSSRSTTRCAGSSIRHISVRHEEGGTHSADGCRADHRRTRDLDRHLRPRRYEHDHRALHGARRLDPDDLHHRPGEHERAAPGGVPGRRHRRDRPARLQVGLPGQGDRAAAVGVSRGIPDLPRGPPRPGAARPAAQRPEGPGHRVGRGDRHAPGLCRSRAEAGRHRARAGAARESRAADHRRRRRRDRRQRGRRAGRAGRDARHPGLPHADGQGRDSRRPSAVGGHGGDPDVAAAREPAVPGVRRGARGRRPVRRPPHRRPRRLPRRPHVHPHRHRTAADRKGVPGRPRDRGRCQDRADRAGAPRDADRAPRSGRPAWRRCARPTRGARTSTTTRSSRRASIRNSTSTSTRTPSSSPRSASTRSGAASSSAPTSRATTCAAARPARSAGRSRPASGPSWPRRTSRSWAWSATTRSSS